MIDIGSKKTGTYSLPEEQRQPDDNGVVECISVQCPRLDAICHYTAFQRHDPMHQSRPDQAIGGGANRVQGLRIDRWSEAIEGGLFAIARLPDAEWLALLPLAGSKSLAWFAPQKNELTVKVGTLGTEPVDGALPVLAWARSADVYDACKQVWRLALEHPDLQGLGRLREEKHFPDILGYLGWCSWEQYKRSITSEKLVSATQRINHSDLPIRFVLVDDGYFRHTGEDQAMSQQLVEFGPREDDFPEGWEPLLATRRDDGVKWFGLWQNFNGYWGTIARDNRFGDRLNSHLMDVPEAGRLPRPTLPDATAWYEAMIGHARQWGFDFVKVDNQAKNLLNYRSTDNAVRGAVCSSQAFERATDAHVTGVINCMAHGPVSVTNTRISVVTRCSEDYRVNDAWRAKAHLHNSYQNMLWLAPTVWGDHDMFHSSDTFAGRMMAVSKAVSGGPVYLSDDPDDFAPELVRPLCFDDGRLLRPLAPAAPMPRSVCIDPFEDREPYLAAAPLPNGAAAVVAYNLTEPTQVVSGAITAADYKSAAGFLSVENHDWPVAHEGIVLYDWYAGTCVRLDSPWRFTLEEFDDRFLLLCPIAEGWAVIGRTDKYLSPAGVEIIETRPDELILRNPEPGPITVWCNGKLQTTDAPPGIVHLT